MRQITKAIRGMNDILPDRTPRWQWLEQAVRNVVEAYGYDEIRLPILEHTSLFERSIGESTDIVEKEMYTFTDRNGDSLTLRPEGTASCVRAGLEHGLFHQQSLRLWYMGPMFRRERPQKGRYRQFHQIGVEAFGMPGPDVDAEIILMTSRLWREIGLADLRLEINTLGTPETRARYRQDLIAYFSQKIEALDEDSRQRLHTNPLRILDSKNPDMKDLIHSTPTFEQYLDTGSAEHFEQLKELLTVGGVEFQVNPRLVRGLDYYNRTVFEWLTTRLGAQGTVCGGGRYDGLVSHFGGRPTAAIGFAIGLDRLIALLPEDSEITSPKRPHIYLIAVGAGAFEAGLRLAESLRNEIRGLRVLNHCGGGSYKSQFKRADKSGAPIALVLGDDELAKDTVTVKFLRRDATQMSVSSGRLVDYLRKLFVAGNLNLEEQTKPYEAV